MRKIIRLFYAFCPLLSFFLLSHHNQRAIDFDGYNAPFSSSEVPVRVKQTQFQPPCKLPFDLIAGPARFIDSQCGLEGSARSVNGRLQNSIKNNYCADGDPFSLSFNSFDVLQKRVDDLVARKLFSYGNDSHLPDATARNLLRALSTVDENGNQIRVGEGDVVSLVGRVKSAGHSNTEQKGEHGETVNCNDKTPDGNDIHIVLVQKPEDSDCESVIAEIIPHFRPRAWNRFDSDPTIGPLVNGLPVAGIVVRIRGQLFFDASHLPCTAQAASRPARRTNFEIHPVYGIDVLWNREWIPFDQWAKVR